MISDDVFVESARGPARWCVGSSGVGMGVLVLFAAAGSFGTEGAGTKTWQERGYADFADGTFGSGGQNLYVSREGVLQRIHQFDVNRDGFVDLLFVNAQDMNERAPTYVYDEVFGAARCTKLPNQGAYTGAVGDLNGDGCDDLVIANQHNGTHSDVTAYVYYGGPDGFTQRRKIELPAPNSRAVAVGDFDGSGRPDIAFGSNGRLRVFYQTETCFLPGKSTDLDIEVAHMTAGDLDGDGCGDLYARVRKSGPLILWGGRDGLALGRTAAVGGADVSADELPGSSPGWVFFAEGWVPRIVEIDGTKHIFRPVGKDACFFAVDKNRKLATALKLACEDAVSAGAGDINGDGRDDIAIAVCRSRSEKATSWIYWGTEKGFEAKRRTALPTISARDAAVGDLDGDGHADVVLCQGRTNVLYDTESLVFRGCKAGIVPEPVRLATHDATTALLARVGDRGHPRVVFINHVSGRVRGDMPATVYYGGPGPDHFSVKRRTELPGWSAPDAQCCDFNDDGWADILICNCAENAVHLDPGSFLYWGGPEGFRRERKTALPTIRAHGSAVGDFRHSGYLDLAMVGFFNYELLIFRGGPNGFDRENPKRILLDPALKDYRPTRTTASGAAYTAGSVEFREPRWLLAADFNKDAWLDLFVSQCYGAHSFILWGGREGFSLQRSQRLAAEGAICARVADLTGNGWLDLILGGHQCLSKNWRWESYIYVYWGGPDGYREDRRMQLPANTCNSLAIADFNKDGVLDIFATSYHAGRVRDCDSFLYWGSPGGVYSESEFSRFFTHSACGCVAADFNEDGHIDLAVASHRAYGNHVAKSQVWWNSPKGFSEQRITELPTTGPHGMLTAPTMNIMDSGPAEYYVSSAFRLPASVSVKTVRWEATCLPKTWVRAQLRFASSREGLALSRWQGPNGSDGWFENGQAAKRLGQDGRWLQYRLALGAINGGCTPRVTAVTVEYK